MVNVTGCFFRCDGRVCTWYVAGGNPCSAVDREAFHKDYTHEAPTWFSETSGAARKVLFYLASMLRWCSWLSRSSHISNVHERSPVRTWIEAFSFHPVGGTSYSLGLPGLVQLNGLLVQRVKETQASCQPYITRIRMPFTGSLPARQQR